MGVSQKRDKTIILTNGRAVPMQFVAVGALSGWSAESAPAAKNRMRNRQRGPKRRVPHAPTAIGGIADGVRRSTAVCGHPVTWLKVLELVNRWLV